MNNLLSELETLGCDIQGSMERFLDDEEFYLSCFKDVLEDPAFEQLGTALKENKVQESFDYAHTLKGIIANLGITPLYDIIVQIVEPLRTGTATNLLPLYEELLAKRKIFQDAI